MHGRDSTVNTLVEDAFQAPYSRCFSFLVVWFRGIIGGRLLCPKNNSIEMRWPIQRTVKLIDAWLKSNEHHPRVRDEVEDRFADPMMNTIED